MLPIWPKYYSNVHAVVFTLDVSDAASIAPAAVELYELLQVGWNRLLPWRGPRSRPPGGRGRSAGMAA